MRACLLAMLICLACAAPAGAATVSVDGSTLRVTALPGEPNAITVLAEDALEGPQLVVTDPGAPLSAGAGCLPGLTPDRVTCAAAAVTSVSVSAGDLDDSVEMLADLPARLTGGDGDDQLRGRRRGTTGSTEGAVRTGPTAARRATPSAREVKGLPGLQLRARRATGGRAGSPGCARSHTARRFVEIPGQNGARIDRRLLKSVLYLVRRYRIRIGDGLRAARPQRPRRAPARAGRGHHTRPRRQLAPGRPAGEVGRAAPEPPAPAVQVGGLQRRRQPRPRRPPPPRHGSTPPGGAAAPFAAGVDLRWCRQP